MVRVVTHIHMSDVTRLLEAAAAGDRRVAADLLPLVYDELRKLAAARMAAEAPGHTLDATALVNEAWLKLNANSFFITKWVLSGGRGRTGDVASRCMDTGMPLPRRVLDS